MHGEAEGRGAAAAGVDHRHHSGAGLVGVLERRIFELAGVDGGSVVAGIGVALGIMVSDRDSADEVAALMVSVRTLVKPGTGLGDTAVTMG